MKFAQPADYKPFFQGAGYVVADYIHDQHPDLTYIRKNCMVAHFDGLNTLLEFLPVHMPKSNCGQNSSVTDGDGDPDWANYSYDEALKIFRETPSKVRDFEEKDTLIEGGDTGLQLEYDTTGDMLDVGRFLDGEPEVFSSLVNGTPRGKRVNILVNLVHAGVVRKKWINDRNKRIVRLVDWLEAQNVRVQVTAIISSNNCHVEIEAKLYHEPLDLNTMAVIGHADFFRRMGFRLTEWSKTIAYGYGNAREFQEALSLKPELLGDVEGDELGLIVGNINRDIDNEFNALEKTLEKVLSGEETAHRLGVFS